MKLLYTWFSFRGQMRLFDFIVLGFTPGIVLGVIAMLLDDLVDSHGRIIFPFLAFSLWPAAAMLLKVARSSEAKNVEH